MCSTKGIHFGPTFCIHNHLYTTLESTFYKLLHSQFDPIYFFVPANQTPWGGGKMVVIAEHNSQGYEVHYYCSRGHSNLSLSFLPSIAK
jgi:hypothetical protein